FLGVTMVNGIVFILYNIGKESLIDLNSNPWESYLGRGMQSYSFFFWTPFLILLVSAMLYLEHKAESWKILFTLPSKPSSIILYKLLSILICVGLVLLLQIGGFYIVPILINFFIPEFEFWFYQPNFNELIQFSGNLFAYSLGIIGIQYCLSTLISNQIVSIGVGFFSFIVGFMLAIQKSQLASFFPYSFPADARGSTSITAIGISVATFILFTLITLKKNNN
ncbi:MAG: ABC transporter permease, partial [Bacteroidota bacterium]